VPRANPRSRGRVLARRFGVTLLALLGCVRPALARAERCGSAERPWLSVEFASQAALAHLEGAIVKDLRAGFATRGIDVCAKSDGPTDAPVAIVRVRARVADSLLVNVEVLDTLTQKSVSRDMNLGRVPKDGQAFAIALGTDELVWASWAELAFERAQRRSQSAPPEIERGVREDLPHPRPQPVQLLARGAFEWFSGGQAFWGGDAGVLWPVASRLELQLTLGVREGLVVSAPNGEITSSALSGDVAGELLFFRSEGVRSGALLGVRMARVRMQGTPGPRASASVLERAIVVVRTGLGLELRVGGPLWLAGWAGIGLPVRGLAATDSGVVVSGVTGVELSSQLGVGVSL
jgi:hypothetical protein